MEMIAASKMRRSQNRVLSGRPYAEKIREVLGDVAANRNADGPTHPLMEVRPVKRIEIILLTSDRGLKGGFNGNMNRAVAQMILSNSATVSIVPIGRKGRDFMNRMGREIRAEFSNLGDFPELFDVIPVARVAMDDFRSGYVDEVYVAYSKFLNTLVQVPTIEKILPIEPPPDVVKTDYIYEPDVDTVLNELAPRYVEMQIYHAVIESRASEQSAQMVAMRNATENAKEVIGELTLTANKIRQEMITSELLDIVGGVAALGG